MTLRPDLIPPRMPFLESIVAEHLTEFGRDGAIAPDGPLDAAAFHRNHQPIWAVLEKFLAGKFGEVLEAGSGTGQHVVHFARQSPDIVWWPSDLSEAHLRSIAAWRAQAGLSNIRPPLRIDLTDPDWFPATDRPGQLLAVCLPPADYRRLTGIPPEAEFTDEEVAEAMQQTGRGRPLADIWKELGRTA